MRYCVVGAGAVGLSVAAALTKAGFVPCGEIRLVGGCEDGDLRIAFEKIL